MSKKFAEWQKVSNQALRVYHDHTDTTGRILCQSHRDSYFTLYPSARGAGEYGGQCEACRNA